jgi:CBS domain-containing protein
VDWQAPIERHMVRQPVSVRRSVSIAAAIQLMSSGGYRRLPVVDADDRPVGMIQVASIVHYLVEHFPSAVYNQPPVAHPVTHDREGS